MPFLFGVGDGGGGGEVAVCYILSTSIIVNRYLLTVDGLASAKRRVLEVNFLLLCKARVLKDEARLATRANERARHKL